MQPSSQQCQELDEQAFLMNNQVANSQGAQANSPHNIFINNSNLQSTDPSQVKAQQSPIYSQDSPQLLHHQKIKKVENLQSYLTNSYEQKMNNLRSSSQQQVQRNHNLQLVSAELQKILSPREIRELAYSLTSKSVTNLNNQQSAHNRSTNSMYNSQNRSFSQQNQLQNFRNSRSSNYDYIYQGQRQQSLNASYTEYLRQSQNRSVLNSSQQHQQSRSLSANRAQLRLYHYNEVKKEKTVLLDKLISQQAKETANSRKISKKSNQLLTYKMENTLNNALQQVDLMRKNNLNFEQIGRVLYQLKVFQCLQYDENCHIVPFQNNPSSTKQMEVKRRFAEMYFHEEFWNICSINNESVEAISTEIVYCLIRILLDPVKLTTIATVNLIREYLLKYNQNQEEYIMSDTSFEEQLIKLVEAWKELEIDQFAYKKIGFLKPKQFEEFCYRRGEMLTFHPKIEKTSEHLELHNTFKFLQENPIEGLTPDVYEQKQREYEEECGMNNGYENRNGSLQGSDQISPSRFQLERYKILYKKQEKINEKIFNLRQEKNQKEKEQCTFKPDLTINSKINEHSILLKYNGHVNIFDRLYQVEPLEERLKKEEQVYYEKQQEELNQCTFKPNVNRSRISGINEKIDAKDLVRDFEKSVGRVKTGFQRSQILKQKLEKVSKGERYDSLKKLKPAPPTLLSRQIQKEKPFSQFKVSLSKNKVVTISLRESDDPHTFARNFAKIHQISPSVEKELEGIIRNLKEEYLKNQKNGSTQNQN
ncbi:hypothetical protein ABPG72_017108 [Tetrahymena utriculariae]